jgi:hypothetical protein
MLTASHAISTHGFCDLFPLSGRFRCGDHVVSFGGNVKGLIADWGQVARRGVSADRVVEGLDVFEDRGGLGPGGQVRRSSSSICIEPKNNSATGLSWAQANGPQLGAEQPRGVLGGFN